MEGEKTVQQRFLCVYFVSDAERLMYRAVSLDYLSQRKHDGITSIQVDTSTVHLGAIGMDHCDSDFVALVVASRLHPATLWAEGLHSDKTTVLAVAPRGRVTGTTTVLYLVEPYIPSRECRGGFTMWNAPTVQHDRILLVDSTEAARFSRFARGNTLCMNLVRINLCVVRLVLGCRRKTKFWQSSERIMPLAKHHNRRTKAWKVSKVTLIR